MNNEQSNALLRFATHDDGGMRDLNLTGVQWKNLPALITRIEDDFERARSHVNGNPLPTPNWTETFERIAKDDGSLQVEYKSTDSLVTELQLFVATGEASATYVELSFSPADVVPSATGIALYEWFLSLRTMSDADEFFFRYENAGWEEGDVGPKSGVVATSRWIKEWDDTSARV